MTRGHERNELFTVDGKMVVARLHSLPERKTKGNLLCNTMLTLKQKLFGEDSVIQKQTPKICIPASSFISSFLHVLFFLPLQLFIVPGSGLIGLLMTLVCDVCFSFSFLLSVTSLYFPEDEPRPQQVDSSSYVQFFSSP